VWKNIPAFILSLSWTDYIVFHLLRFSLLLMNIFKFIPPRFWLQYLKKFIFSQWVSFSTKKHFSIFQNIYLIFLSLFLPFFPLIPVPGIVLCMVFSGVHSDLRVLLQKKKTGGSNVENLEYGHRDSPRWPRDTLYSQKWALTLLTRGGHSVSIVHSQTKATEILLL
jgi:hypothetical protein